MLTALSLVLILTNAANVRDAGERSIERNAVAEAERAAAAIERSRFAEERFGDLVRIAGFDYAYLVDAEGAVIEGQAPARPAPLLSETGVDGTERSAFAVMVRQDGYAHGAKALTLSSGVRATLRFGVSLAPAASAGFDAAVHGLITTLIFLALALPGLAILVDRAASPLRALTRAVMRPGAGDAAVRAAGERSDEVGALARAHLSIARDLAENADALHRLTFDDPITRLPNHASLTSRLAAALQLGRSLALVRVEIAGLSRIAAGLGQSHGDETVRAAARRLSSAVEGWARGRGLDRDDGEPSMMVARASDSGFSILAPDADADAARSLAESAVAAFEAPLVVGEHRMMTTLSVGVALAPEDGDEAGALIRSAAAAVSAARVAGPQSVRFAGAELSRMAYGRLRLEQDLRRAIEAGELELHFQPQISLKGGVVSGAEALARWRHPTRGMVPPGEFVSVAEECGLVEPLGQFVIAEASRVAADWHSRGIDVRVAVNVSPLQFRRAGFAERTLEITGAAGADPSQLELEITESAAMGDPQHAARELAPLKAAGLRIAIDDFGTGYSNLSALTRLPFDVLKIDRGFVRDAIDEAGARVVVGTVIGMAENLGFETIAEGVETEEQLRFVTDHGCTYAQGYLFGRPMSVAAFEAWYAERRVSELRAVGERRGSLRLAVGGQRA
ncbi:EAL domain-containing protein [Chenggangzhangella methanolivorans]|uniref:EAL domain-containing protein n=1 Tax=Chenggangzhangella methanolivorans TaxID=1437009 RepID=A0A9E6RCE7_9HYPH|nr:EAL domain-containing protein [Chenggangzhangella methanolivorans]